MFSAIYFIFLYNLLKYHPVLYAWLVYSWHRLNTRLGIWSLTHWLCNWHTVDARLAHNSTYIFIICVIWENLSHTNLQYQWPMRADETQGQHLIAVKMANFAVPAKSPKFTAISRQNFGISRKFFKISRSTVKGFVIVSQFNINLRQF